MAMVYIEMHCCGMMSYCYVLNLVLAPTPKGNVQPPLVLWNSELEMLEKGALTHLSSVLSPLFLHFLWFFFFPFQFLGLFTFWT